MHPLPDSNANATHSFQVMQLGPLTFVYYQDEETGLQCTHCLELDIGGQGDTRDEAEKDLQGAIEVYLDYHFDHEMKEIPACNPATLPQELTGIQDRAAFNVTFVSIEPTRDCPKKSEFHVAPVPQHFNPSALACN